MRRSIGGLPAVALAALVLFARLLAPAMAMPDAVDPIALATICHAGGAGEAPAPPGHPAQHDCLLCPACHLLSHAVLPVPTPPVPPPPSAAIGTARPLPPATGPPGRIRTAAQPTGPPRFSV